MSETAIRLGPRAKRLFSWAHSIDITSIFHKEFQTEVSWRDPHIDYAPLSNDVLQIREPRYRRSTSSRLLAPGLLHPLRVAEHPVTSINTQACNFSPQEPILIARHDIKANLNRCFLESQIHSQNYKIPVNVSKI
jgi:hypothetical protein